MNTLSQSEGGRRTSPRKKKLVVDDSEEREEKRKRGEDKKKKPPLFKTTLNSSDYDSDESEEVKIGKSKIKLKGGTKNKNDVGVKISGTRGEAKREREGGVKGKRLGYESDVSPSSSEESTPPKASFVNRSRYDSEESTPPKDSFVNRSRYDSKESTPPKASFVNRSRSNSKGKHLIKDLLEELNDKEKIIRSLELELAKSKMTTRMNKRKVREEFKWTGEETNFAETVNNFCRSFLFPRNKFLKEKWQDYLPKRMNSLYSLCMRHLKIPEGADERDIWERVIVPSISRKYMNMKCNLNNEIKGIYMSMTDID